jgi:predicted nucleic-acid-binding Zn-ribbon protein
MVKSIASILVIAKLLRRTLGPRLHTGLKSAAEPVVRRLGLSFVSEVGKNSELDSPVVAQYKCATCEFPEYDVGEVRETDTPLSQILNLQRRRFMTVSCRQCGYTDHFERSSAALVSAVDVLLR